MASARPPVPGLVAEGLRLTYPQRGGGVQTVLDIDRIELSPGSVAGITGPPGSGKTSLLYVLTGIERPDFGTVRWGSTELFGLGGPARDSWRQRNVGIIFQDFHLLPGLSPLANTLLPHTFDHLAVDPATRSRASGLLEQLGAPTSGRPVATLSRSEQQRVAIARALLGDPGILVADEPAASLDAADAAAIVDLLLEQAARTAATLLVVTHDPAFLRRLPAVYHLSSGRLTDDAPLAGGDGA